MQISLIIAILLLLSSVALGRVPLNWREAKLMVFCIRALRIPRLQCGKEPHFPEQLQPDAREGACQGQQAKLLGCWAHLVKQEW